MNAHTLPPKSPAAALEIDSLSKSVDHILYLLHGARLIAGMRDDDAEIASIAAAIDTVSEQLDDLRKVLGARSATPTEVVAPSSAVRDELADLIKKRTPIAAAYVEASERFQELKSGHSGPALARWQANQDHEILHHQLVQVEQAIYDYRPTNMAEVAMKAQFAIAEGIEGGLIDRFLRSLL